MSQPNGGAFSASRVVPASIATIQAAQSITGILSTVRTATAATSGNCIWSRLTPMFAAVNGVVTKSTWFPV